MQAAHILVCPAPKRTAEPLKGNMKVLLVGVGGVGEAIAMIARERRWVERLVLCDYNLDRAHEVQREAGRGDALSG